MRQAKVHSDTKSYSIMLPETFLEADIHVYRSVDVEH
jgi:hypothetical protein